MDNGEEYRKLTQEGHNHFDYNMRVITYTMVVVGGVIGLQSNDNIYTITGVFVILFSSLFFLIGSFRKIFLIHAYISARLDKGDKPTWHTLIPKVTKKHRLLYETQMIAFIYFVVTVAFGVLFYQVNVCLVLTLCIVLAALCLWLFVIPLRLPAYTKTFTELAQSMATNNEAQRKK